MSENNILITGGSGFLGRGIMHVAGGMLSATCWEGAHFVVYSRDETKQDVCRSKYPDAKYVLGDVKDYNRLYHAIKDHGVDTVIHTAAIKYIPEAEFNVEESIDVNVMGSRNVALAAYNAGAHTVVGISTDKACKPLNVYGMTKALMERVWGEFATCGRGRYVLARYGNVLGSTGSVVPKFRAALCRGDRIKLTDGQMTRYWLSVQDAVGLIEEAMNPDVLSGSIIIPKPVSSHMDTLVHYLCQDAGVRYDDVVDIIGVRPGEKMHEELMHEQESVRSLVWPSHYELCRVGHPARGGAFALSSENPEGGWLEHGQLREALEWADRI